MNRRTVLSRLGSAAVGITFGSAVVGADTDGELPAMQVPNEGVKPWPWEDQQSVETGEWIKHTFGFFSDQSNDFGEKFDSPCDGLDHLVEISEFKVELPDRTFDFGEGREYWSDCREATLSWDPSRKGMERMWEFYTQPKPPGEYEFKITIRYLEYLEICDPRGCWEIHPGTYHFEPASYEVTPSTKGKGNR